MLTLYNFPQSTCSQKVRISLFEKDLEFEDRILKGNEYEHLSDWYLKLNPNGVVPTLVHDDAVIIDSSVILEYLDEVFPEPSLTMPDPVGRAHMRKWLRYFEEVPTPAIRVPSFNDYIARRYDNMDAETYQELRNKHTVRQHFYDRLAGNRFSEAETKEAMERLQQSVDRVNDALADGRPWIMGERLTDADLCLLPTIDRLNDLGHAGMWAERPHVAGWYDRFQQRPSFAKTYYPGTRLSENYQRREPAAAE
jgi:glutathione S-transferase